MYAPPQIVQPSVVDKGKGKEKVWDDQFEKYSALANVKDKEEKVEAEEPKGKGKEEVDLEEVWRQHQDPHPDEDLKSWEQEFSQFANGSIASAYEELEADQHQRYLDELQTDDALAEGTTDERGFPRLGKYEFGKFMFWHGVQRSCLYLILPLHLRDQQSLLGDFWPPCSSAQQCHLVI